MCGIAGIFADPRAEAAAEHEHIVRAMMARLAHRGPDGEGLFARRGVTLGHRRLAIIDLEHGAQPMTRDDGARALTYNGEIYNYVELRQHRCQSGGSFHTFSDTEVLLDLLATEGAAAISRLNGMFAFAYADTASGAWLLARDPFGIKPLYYTVVGETVVFASEIKALFEHPGVRRAADAAAIEQYLTFQFVLDDATLFNGIHKVEPGHYIRGRHGRIEAVVQYWDTNYRIDEHHTEAFFRDTLRSLLEDSARLQMRSDVRVGACLSGGLDSSVVACLAAGHAAAPLPVFNGRFAEAPDYDESAYARLVAASIGGQYHDVVPTAAGFVELLPRLIYHMDEPVAGPGLFPQYIVSRAAAGQVKVMLGGQGGDEIFGGYARYLVGYLEQAIKGAVFETQEEGQHIVTLRSIIANLPMLRQYAPMLRHFWQDGLFEDMDARYFRLIDRSPGIRRLLSADARAGLDRERLFARFQSIFNHPDTKSYLNKMTHFDQKTLLPALLQVEDRVSMAVSIESRVPLLDTRIVDLVTSMPPPMKFMGGAPKYIFRRAVETLVPPQILARKDKMGFPVPLKEWKALPQVRNFLGDVLLSEASRSRGLFDMTELERLVAGDGGFDRQLWGVLCLELWYQTFIDRTP